MNEGVVKVFIQRMVSGSYVVEEFPAATVQGSLGNFWSNTKWRLRDRLDTPPLIRYGGTSSTLMKDDLVAVVAQPSALEAATQTKKTLHLPVLKGFHVKLCNIS